MIEIITFGAGCFWCVEACFKELKGVIQVESGYAGGNTDNPSYEEVCSGKTNHAEVVQITYNSEIITLKDLLEVFWFIHNPTQVNRQGNDIGTQYRSVIFYHNDKQKEISEIYKNKLEENKVWDSKIVTEIIPLNNYFKAENYHQDYLKQNPDNAYCKSVVRPKYEKFKQVFSNKVRIT